MATTINEQIKILIDLQKVDAEIYQLKRELAGIPSLLKKNEADFEKKKAVLKAAEAEHQALYLKQKEKENSLQTQEEKIKKLQTQLYQLKSNKEYSAMDMEIKSFKADHSVLEEEILRLLDAVDQAKARCVKEKEHLNREEMKFKEVAEELKKRSLEGTEEIQHHEEKRKAFVPQIEPRLLAQYERILKNREGLALVPVKNNSCGGCHMELPPQVVHEVYLQDKLIICESCARILYGSL